MTGLNETGSYTSIPNRKLTEETCRRYGYKVGTDLKGRACHIAPYFDASGTLVAQKIRFKEDGKKAFTFLGEPKRAGLFGAPLMRESGKMIVITEGEIDAMSVSQAMGNKWPVVSIPNGASGAKKDLAPHITLLETYEKVVICFDMDDPGRKAVEDCIPLFSPGKLSVAILPEGFKDASDMLVAGQSGDLVSCIWNARPYRPDGIRGVSDLREQALTPVQPGFDWPWQSLTDATYGIRRKELYALGAGVGCGKTEVFKEIIVKTIKDGRPAGVIFLEEPPAHTVKVIAGKMVGRLFHIPGYDYKPEELSAAIDTLEGKLWVYDHFGAKGYDDVKQRIIFLVTVMGCKDIFLDHMTALVAGEEDERRALDYIMADLAGLAERHDFTLYYISHLSTPDGKPHEEGGRVYERHFTGSRALARWSHYMFALERDKQNPSKPTTFRILKDRYTGRGTGKTFGLGYDVESGMMVEVSLSEDNPFDGEDDDV